MNNFMSDRPGFYQEITTTAGGGGSSSNNNGGGGDEDSEEHNNLLRPGGSTSTAVIEREHMFDKVVTPSDVGKLNRLVIPKQHAEKYFPLDSSANEKGLLLNFEDRNGKPWRFRYSYWNSSQSYVMTKGWSRFVKEKKLDAGDIVSFQRGLGDVGKDRLFIDWRRRPDAPDLLPPPLPHHFSSFQYRSGWNPLFLSPPSREYSYSSPYHQYQHHQQQQSHHQHHHPYNYGGGGYTTSTVVNGNPCPPGSIFYLRPGGQMAGGSTGGGIIVPGRPQLETAGSGVDEQMVYESVPVVQGKAAAKRLRLFGVNMDCPIDDQDETTTSDECDMHLSNATTPLHHYFPTTTTAAALPSPTSSSSIHQYPNSSLRLRPYNSSEGGHINKGKGSMSLDLDI